MNETITAEEYKARLSIDSKGKITLKPAVIVPPAEKKLTAASEDEVWEECKQRLKQHGFYPPNAEYLSPMKSVHGFYVSTQQKRRSKVSKGLSDVFIVLAGVPIFIPIELKPRELTKKGKLRKPVLSKEQKILRKAGCIFVVRSAEDIDHVIKHLRDIMAHKQLVGLFQHMGNVPSKYLQHNPSE